MAVNLGELILVIAQIEARHAVVTVRIGQRLSDWGHALALRGRHDDRGA